MSYFNGSFKELGHHILIDSQNLTANLTSIILNRPKDGILVSQQFVTQTQSITTFIKVYTDSHTNGSIGITYGSNKTIEYNQIYGPYLNQGYVIVGRTFDSYEIFRLNGKFEYCDPWNVRDKRLTKYL